MQRFVPDAFAGRPSTMATDVGLLILRLAIAAVFVRHGWSDVFESGVSTNVQNYADAGIPLAGLSAPFAAYMQLLGGFLVAVGALTRPVSLGLTIVMAGALVFVHRGESLVMGQDGSGSGYAFIMCAASIMLLLAGPGRFSLDRVATDRWPRTDRTAQDRQHSLS